VGSKPARLGNAGKAAVAKRIPDETGARRDKSRRYSPMRWPQKSAEGARRARWNRHSVPVGLEAAKGSDQARPEVGLHLGSAQAPTLQVSRQNWPDSSRVSPPSHGHEKHQEPQKGFLGLFAAKVEPALRAGWFGRQRGFPIKPARRSGSTL